MNRTWWYIAAIALTLAVAACADDGDSEDTTGGTASTSSTQSTSTTSTPSTTTQEPPASTSTSAPTTSTTTQPPTTTERPRPEGELAFSTHVMPVMQHMCAQCHTAAGPGTAHLRMDTAGDIAANADLVSAALATGDMPPWPASRHGVAFIGELQLAEHEIESVIEWARNPELDIDPATPVESSVGTVGLTSPDLTIEPIGAYDGRQYEPDEYRCFIYDPGFETEQWLTSYEFVPDQTEIVHHAIGYHLPASQRARADELDAAHPEQGGWPCFGGSRLSDDGIFLGWAPGQGPTHLPEGSGMTMQAGDFIVIQVHYHFEIDAPPDRSRLLLELAPNGEVSAGLDPVTVVEFVAPAEIPCTTDEAGPLCDRDAALAAAVEKYGSEGVLANQILALCRSSVDDYAHMTDGLASASCDLPVREAGVIISVLGHEHELGSSFRMTLNPGTSDEVVLLDIPEWDFDWQYNYYPVEQIEVAPSDMVRIECSWDRSLRDPDLEPAYVLWADGTDDEMCFATIVVRETA